jgi:ubiquinone/menaquinone biosynthesis C-methylase UbiE
MTTEQLPAPNHHAGYPGFAGPTGFLAAASMVAGGKGNARLAERLSELAAGDVVADIGCGPGTAARRAARLGASVIGVDPAPVMLRLARLLTRRSTHAVRYAEGSAEALPLPDSSVSVAWSIASVHHWTDLDAGLKEARRVLKPGGRLVAIERLTRPGATGLASHGWTPEQASAFADRCLAHGFTGARVNRHGSGRRTKVSVTATAP